MDRAQKVRFSRIKIADSGKIAQARDLKLQIPTSKIQGKSKLQNPKKLSSRGKLLGFGDSYFHKAWVIVLTKYSLVYRQPAPLDSCLGSNALANSAVETYKFVGQDPTRIRKFSFSTNLRLRRERGVR